ncbi:MAG: ZIP family metal transporter [Patescibacteria group bacterium]
MTTIWLYSIISVFIVSLVSLIGIVTLSLSLERLRKILLFLVSFAAGSMLGGAFIHLLPEAFEIAENVLVIPYAILLAMIIFFAIEKVLHWRHCHEPTSKEHPHPLGVNNLIGDAFHNLIDGTIIAGSYMVDIPLGVATTIAVLLHEIPQEIGDFGVLIHAGYTKNKAIFYNFLTALTAIFGAVITLLIGSRVEAIHQYIVPFTIGGFIYIATADLIPELKKETGLGKSSLQLASLILGIGVMSLLLLFE